MNHARHGTGELADDFAAKAIEVPRWIPLLHRPWFRLLLSGGTIATGLAAAIALGFFNRWHDDRLTEMARQRNGLAAFLRSAEFGRFVQAADAQLVATLNFVAARPQEAQDLLPAVAARDKLRREMPWPLEVRPLPVSAATDPVRVAQTGREVTALLARRGHVVDEAARKSARQLFLQTLAPFAQEFAQRHPDNAPFAALALDRAMQEQALAAYAAHHGPGAGVAATERLFSFYAAVGPAMWRAIEADRVAAARPVFSAVAR